MCADTDPTGDRGLSTNGSTAKVAVGKNNSDPSV